MPSAVYTGTAVTALTPVNDQGRFFHVTAGQTYWVAGLDSWGAPTVIDLDVRAYPVITNDAFSSPIDLGDVESWRERIVFDGATNDPAEPIGFVEGTDVRGSRWWTWTPQRDVMAVIAQVPHVDGRTAYKHTPASKMVTSIFQGLKELIKLE